MIHVVRGSYEKPASTSFLINYFEKRTDLEGILYLGYPIIGSVDGALDIDALLVTKQYGAVIFDIVEGITPEDRSQIQDELYMKVQAKLTDYSSLVHRRELMVDIAVATVASAWRATEELEYDVLTNNDDIDHFLQQNMWSNTEYYSKLLQAIQAVTKIKSTPKRKKVTKADSKGAILKQLEESISNLDSNQSAAVIETAEGAQRIRGLAGSGKTIVLALKVAYLHSKHPEWTIAVTFNTRALKKQFEDLITRFVYEHTRDKPNWNKVRIIQAWGSPSNEGIYYEVCKKHNIEYYDLGKAKSLAFSGNEFEEVCKKALQEIVEFKPMYDVILVDEAQDFSKEFLLLCYEILANPKRLIFAYDELQTLNRQSMPSPEEIFGLDSSGKPRVILKNEKDKPKQDIILKVCYRNSRPVLATAHSLGFGVNYEDGLIQMFGDKGLWKDVGYQVVNGELSEGTQVALARTIESSPRFLESHSPIDELIQFTRFKDDLEQVEWVASQIKKNLDEDELEYQDIMVIHTDPLTTKNAVAPLRKQLYSMGINSHIAGTANPDIFHEEDSITITGIYRAKGNEAGMVYVINGQNCYSGPQLSKKRNILFTAITRTKGWVRVVGYGERMEALAEEYQKLKQDDFELKFVYPTEEQRKRINVIHRDITQGEKKKIETNISSLAEIVKALQSGEMYIEDLPEDLKVALKGLLLNE